MTTQKPLSPTALREYSAMLKAEGRDSEGMDPRTVIGGAVALLETPGLGVEADREVIRVLTEIADECPTLAVESGLTRYLSDLKHEAH